MTLPLKSASGVSPSPGHQDAASTSAPTPYYYLPPLYRGVGSTTLRVGVGGGADVVAPKATPPHGSAPKCPFGGKGVFPYLPEGTGRYPLVTSNDMSLVATRQESWQSRPEFQQSPDSLGFL